MKRRTGLRALLFTNSILLGLCFGLAACDRSDASKPIVAGAVLPMTGPAATFGKWGAAGIEMAAEDINRSGGIKGRKLRVVIEDSAGDPTKGVTSFRKLLATDHPEVVFSIVSAVDLALAPIAEKENVLLFSHAAHPEITRNRRHVLRHSNTVGQESQKIASALEPSDVAKGVAILYVNDDYGSAFADQLTALIRRRFAGVLINMVPFSRDETSFSAQVTSALRPEPSSVIVAGVGKSTGLPIRRLREQGFRGKIMATLAFLATDGPAIAGDAADGVWCMDFEPPSESEISKLKERYKQRTGDTVVPMGVIVFYSSTKLWAEARTIVNKRDPDQIAAYVKGLKEFTSLGRVLHIDENGDILPPVRLIRYSRKAQ